MSFGEKNFSQIKGSFLKFQLQGSKQKNTLKPELQENSVTKKNSSSSSLFTFPTSSSSTSSSKADEDILSDIVGWRRAIAEDVPAIKKLHTLSRDTANLFYSNINNIDEIVDKSYLSIVQYNSKDDLVSFTAYDSYPNIPSIQIFWDDWLAEHYRFDDVNPSNVLFIHYMLWLPDETNKFLPLLLEAVFTEFTDVKYIVMIKPPKAVIPEFCKNYFIPILPPDLNELEYDSIQSILICLRTSIICPLRIRTAFECEIDVIISAIRSNLNNSANSDKCCSLDLVNFFYQQDRKALIYELEGELAGIMTINLKVDLDTLNEGFELAPFNGLRKKNYLDQNSELPTEVSEPSLKIPECPNILISSEFLFSQFNWEIMVSKKTLPDKISICSNNKCNLPKNESSEFSLISWSSVFEKPDEKENNTEILVKSGEHEFFHKTADIKVAFRTSGVAMTHFFAPQHHGQSNAFLIDFFAIDCDKVDEKLSSFDFLEAAFRNVPDRDYCVLIIPTDILPFPLLDLFVRVTPRPMSSFKKELYLCHKKSLSVISMYVRSAEEDDLPSIYYFLKHVNEGNAVYQDILKHCFVNNEKFQSFVLLADKKIIGVSLINRRDSVERYKMLFNVAEFTSFELNQSESGTIIKHFIISPKHRRHARFFLRDIMRLADVPCLYYIKNKSSKVCCGVLTVLEEFYPVKPKKKARLKDLSSHTQFPPSREKKSTNSFGLYFMSPRFCGLRKTDVNIIIIVVGASQTSLSFLESLIFGSDSRFICYNNLICVTPHEPETESEHVDINFMFPITDNFSKEYSSMLSLGTYVNFLYGVMTGINRSEKYIVVNNKNKIRYDYLILTCGLQYFPPTLKTTETSSRKNKNFRSSLARFLLPPSDAPKIHIPKHPKNMFIINTRNDAKTAIHALQFLLKEVQNGQEDKKIVIYGHDLHSFLTIQTLLKLGIPGEVIVFVEPFPDNATVAVFTDSTVDKAVIEAVKKCKVNYFTEYFLYDWSINSDDYISSLTFHSSRKQVVIPCLAFFPFLEKLVSDVTFNACNDAGLVYDGRLVINHYFRTNDSYIFAAGPFTKYARRYFADEYNHQYYNSTEIGQKLAQIIKEKIDPFTRVENEEASDLVPKMKAPVFLYCQLPGDYNFFTLRKPGKELAVETAFNFVNYGEVLITGDCKMKGGFGYFRLHLDAEGFVQSITCYTKDKIDYTNLPALYGLHEKLLNNLLFRYDMSQIPDFFEYFRQPWALALFHENFHLLRDCNMQSFYEKSSDNKDFPGDLLHCFTLNDWKPLPQALRKEFESDFTYSEVEAEIKNNLLQFMELYKQDLEMYVIPTKEEVLKLEKTEP